MNSRQVAILGAVMVALIALAGWIAISRTPAPPETSALYPSLKGRLTQVSGIKIMKAGAPVVELERKDGEWIVKQRNFPADKNKIGALLVAMEDAQLREEKTGNPQNYATLGVEEEGNRIDLIGVDPPIQLIVGKQDPTTQFSYARRVGEKTSWLLSTSIAASSETNQWLSKGLLDIKPERVQEIAIQPASGPRYTVIKNSRDEANFDVTGIPKGREVESVSATNAQAQALSNLQLDDVRPVADFAAQKPVALANFKTFDGLIVELRGYSLEGKQWVIVQPTFDADRTRRFFVPPPAKTVPADANPVATHPGTAKAEEQKPESLETLMTNAKAEADAIGRKTSGWAFELAAYKYDALFKPLEELLKKK
jgi:hypothetical protein